VVKDQRTGKSKGMAFVEFFQPESIEKALLLNKQRFMNQQIIVNVTQAERNRGHLNNKWANQVKAPLSGLLPD
jgi:RNA-binding protein 39